MEMTRVGPETGREPGPRDGLEGGQEVDHREAWKGTGRFMDDRRRPRMAETRSEGEDLVAVEPAGMMKG